MGQRRRSWPPDPGRCFAWFSWSVQRTDSNRWAVFISELNEETGQCELSSRLDLVGERLTAAHVQQLQDLAVEALRRHIAGVVNRSLTLF